MPPCVSCLFGQANHHPWLHKLSTTSTNGVLRSAEITNPGQQVVTDQIVLAQPGIVPQEKGKMTRARIWGATFFADYASRWVKVHLMQDETGELTLEAKNDFEQDCVCLLTLQRPQFFMFTAENNFYSPVNFSSQNVFRVKQP